MFWTGTVLYRYGLPLALLQSTVILGSWAFFDFRLFQQHKSWLNSPQADAYVSRLHFIMLFAASLAGKTKSEVTKALQDILGVNFYDFEGGGRGMFPSTKDNLSVGFLMPLGNEQPQIVEMIKIHGHGDIDKLCIYAHRLNEGDPKQVTFNIFIGQGYFENQSRETPELAKIVGYKLMHHSDFVLCENEFELDPSYGPLLRLKARSLK